MSVLVAAQGEMLNAVEIQVANAAEDTGKGVEALKAAVKSQKKSRKKMIILLVCLAVLAIIGGSLGGVFGSR